MAQVPFTVSARTARLIGRENVANAEGALIELVKNCYDADSRVSVVLIDKPNDTILIIDSGDGMTDEIIREQWMTIGTDDKLNNAITASGRIKSGAKGIGRFALDRLGERCKMITAPIYSNTGFVWEVDWSTFETKKGGKNVNINEVYADLSPINSINYKNELLNIVENYKITELISKSVFDHGTILKIQGLRDEWRNESIERIYSNLELLTPPDGSNKMAIYLYNGAEIDKYGLIENDEFKDFDYKIVATYIKNKDYKIKIQVHRNEFDINLIDQRLFLMEDMKDFPFDKTTFNQPYYTISKSFNELIKGFNDGMNLSENIGDFEFTFYFLKQTFSKDDRDKYKYKDFLGDRSAWLKKFGGIKLYRDNFRVRPYGELNTQGYDWLMLGERYRQNPAAVSRKGAWRVGTNQTAGVVKFSRISNPYLEDKSSREGLQENETFELFKNLLLSIIKIQEDDRSTIAHNLNEFFIYLNEEAKASEESTELANEDETKSLNETPDETKQKTETLKKGIKAKDKKIEQQQEELAISRAMASAGIMIASFSHEFNKIKNKLNTRTNNLRAYLIDVIDPIKLSQIPDRKNPYKLIDDIQKQDEKIKQWVDFSIGLTRKDRRKNKHVNVIEYLNDFEDLWANMLKERNVEFLLQYNSKEKTDFKLKISELDLDTIFDNLLTNSVEAFQRKGFSGTRKITVDVKLIKDKLIIVYKDSGPGIPKEYKSINEILNPFETSKKDDKGNEIGTGLGMWLLKSTVDSNKGQVQIIRPEKGFEIRLSFNPVNK